MTDFLRLRQKKRLFQFVFCFFSELITKMSQDLEQAFLNTVIAFKLMSYSYSLKFFLKTNLKKTIIILYRSHMYYMLKDMYFK